MGFIDFIQILFNSIVSGLVVSLVAIGFIYVFNVTGVFHLAYGGLFVLGAYTFNSCFDFTGLWWVSLFTSFIVVSLATLVIEKTIYLPLNREGADGSISLISSMGLYIVIVNIVTLLWGNENLLMNHGVTGSWMFGDITITKIQIIQLVGGLIMLTVSLCYLFYTKSNLIFRAISDNEGVSKSLGVNIEKERLKVFIWSSILVTIAGVLEMVEFGVDPHAGIEVTLLSAVIAILVSRLNISFVVLFSISMLLIQNIVEWFFNAQWAEAITYIILLWGILFRTEGIISYKIRKDRL